MGVSKSMEKKDWTDAQGRKGKGYGVYRFANKYGANVDGYSPIYTPDTWSESGDTYKLGTKGLVAWAGLIAVLLGVSWGRWGGGGARVFFFLSFVSHSHSPPLPTLTGWLHAHRVHLRARVLDA